MIDPEENLNFKLKRNQFNNRIPVQLIDMFDEFGDDKKYLLEYLIWIACKEMGTKFVNMQEFEVAMLEKYFAAIKGQLKAHPQFGPEIELLFGIERDLEQKMKESLQRKVRSTLSRDQDT
ncbi:MAG TPA: hypothetical protein VKM55_10800 [Candidatus Lokiarchaeia archaeon]|nr:hypothetical protein [Candidatus Lokiarchaeia archaeon]